MEAKIMQRIAESILAEIEILLRRKPWVLVAIDGRCGAGKTTLGAQLQRSCYCTAVPMDHFFLCPEQRTAARLEEPGGNVDYERFLKEVLLPLKQRKSFSYYPYDCRKQAMGKAIQIKRLPITIIEGSYCCHPSLSAYYDLKVFLSIDETEQLRRIRYRNGESGLEVFQKKWIPLEERYFSACRIREQSDLYFISE